ncbi:MAG TPA: NAD-dependent epimerase/dehydratase family protein [Candidatus Dormibacteraeota bacterium]|nr:NAD-dependent epimerase/dehydratase family protein [Candidatus Dormibacteraeota bacterium]
MRVLLTGGAGFIGSHIADALVERGDEVVVIDDLSTGCRENLNPGVRFHQMDVRSPEAARLVHELRPDIVCHHAAQVSVSRSVREPRLDAEVNLMAALGLLEATRHVGARFVFASTGGALYGDAAVLPTPESYPAWPISPYGVSKLAFEHYLHCYAVQHEISYVALRYANVYGPRQSPHGEAGVVAIFCQRLLAGERPVIHGDGRQTRDYVYISDVVRANLAAMDATVSGHFNVGTGRQVDVNHLFQLIAERVGTGIEAVHGPPRPGDQRTSALDPSLIAERLGWRPQVGLEQGLEETVAWFRARVVAAR